MGGLDEIDHAPLYVVVHGALFIQHEAERVTGKTRKAIYTRMYMYMHARTRTLRILFTQTHTLSLSLPPFSLSLSLSLSISPSLTHTHIHLTTLAYPAPLLSLRTSEGSQSP